jgi:7-dehydrocholesterol reductase
MDGEKDRLVTIERRLGTPLLVLVTPFLALLIWSTLVRHDGSIAAALENGIDWPAPTATGAALLLAFAAFEALLLLVLPGRTVFGPPTPAGLRVPYTDNALPAWVITHLALLALLVSGALPLGLIYGELGGMLVLMSLAGFVGALLVYIKGRVAPSGRDWGLSGNMLFDFFWGIELHPRIGRLDLKQFTISRIAMMGWSVIVLACAAKQYDEQGTISSGLAVSAALQMAYIARFMWWESGYFGTLDVMHDRFGFYLLWGVLGWLPAVYPSAPLYLAVHPVDLGAAGTLLVLLLGGAALAVTHLADVQRQRQTGGACLVWGRKPELIHARYATASGEKESILLVSGYWGLARHFHYASEIALALAWSIPSGGGAVLTYFYPAYLTVLLVHRACRDDRRCRRKYGASWDAYCARVPYLVLPGIF